MRDICEANAALLDGTARLVARLGAGSFTVVLAPAMMASIGAHTRHVLDHYQALLRDLPARRIDYENRARDCRVETDRATAERELRRIAALLADRAGPRVDFPVQVRDGAIMSGGWAHSSLERELGFLLSHTIHHCSLIAVACRLQGIEVAADFGLAPSTLRHMAATRSARAS